MTVAPDPREAPPIRWGILGAGHIASRFVTAVQQHTQGQVVAVGSRDRERGAEFAAAHRIGTGHRIGTVHEGYAALVADPAVDVVYVATPHSEHREHALLAIAAGKHVLVEKAFTRNAVEADFGGSPPYNPTDRNFNPALAGGALLDLGVYPIAFAQDLLGTPTGVTAVGTLAETGVDVESTVTLDFEGRAQAIARSSFLADTPRTAVVIGTEGRIDVDPEFYAPTTLVVTRRDGTGSRFEEPVEGGMQFEAAEVARCIAAGRTESPRVSWQSTLDVMRILDAAREQLGVVYPGE